MAEKSCTINRQQAQSQPTQSAHGAGSLGDLCEAALDAKL